jgi:hypothetical protein
MIMNGACCFNINKSLVNMRAGYAMLSRRGSMGYAINEIKLQYKFLEMGFISNFIFYVKYSDTHPCWIVAKCSAVLFI